MGESWPPPPQFRLIPLSPDLDAIRILQEKLGDHYDVRGWDVLKKDANGHIVRERDGFALVSECLVMVRRKGSSTPELTFVLAPTEQG